MQSSAIKCKQNANECKQLNIPCNVCNEEIFTDETSLLVNNVVCCICEKMCCSNCIQKNKHGQYICSLCNQTTCEFCTKFTWGKFVSFMFM